MTFGVVVCTALPKYGGSNFVSKKVATHGQNVEWLKIILMDVFNLMMQWAKCGIRLNSATKKINPFHKKNAFK